MEKCFMCKGDLENTTTSHMVDLDGKYIIIKDVPCLKCNQCGEIAFSGDVTARLEEIISKLQESLVEVAIVDFAA